MKKNVVLFLLLAMFVTKLSAQTIEEATQAYNAGVTANNEGNLEEAIVQFTACLEMSQKIFAESADEQADNYVMTIKPILPDLYYKLGSSQIKNSEIDKGIATLNKCIEVSKTFGNEATVSKTEKALLQVYYKRGVASFKEKNYESALTDMDQVLVYDPNYVSAYYLKSVVYSTTENDELLKLTANKGIEVALAANDTSNEQKIRSNAKKYFLKKGNADKSAKNYNEAILALNSSLEYDATDATTLYLLSSTYFDKSDYVKAIEFGEKAIANEKGGNEDKAKIYMVIAESNAKNGNVEAACAAYKKAAYGQYTELANYRIEHELKCQ